jgi:DNA polymerase-3 subunit delta'
VSWKTVRGHDQIVATLRAKIENGRFPHAMLFVGPEGVGKRTFARALAQALLCEVNPESLLESCGACPGCLQAGAGTHPDLLEVARPPERSELSIQVIRDLCAGFGLKPARGVRKVAIVDDVDDMNDEAANAFLKTLEEPPPGAVLILIGTSAELQLETIVSRCQVIRFGPLAEPVLAELLLDSGVAATPDDATRLAALGEGSVSRATGLADPELGRFRRELIDELALEHGFDPSELAGRLLSFAKQGSKEAANQRRQVGLLVGELARLFRGVLWQTAGREPPCPDPADRRVAGVLAARLEPEDVFVLADRCLLADYHLQRNLYLPLVLESMFHDLGELINARVSV